jgi:CRP-like cAMP-binding protein
MGQLSPLHPGVTEVWTLNRTVFAAALDDAVGGRPTTASGAETAAAAAFFSPANNQQYEYENYSSAAAGRAGGPRDALAARLRLALTTPPHRRAREDCEVVADALCHLPFLAPLPRHAQLEIARVLRYETAGEGHALFRQGEMGDRAFFCLSGRVRLGGGGDEVGEGDGIIGSSRTMTSYEGGRVGVGGGVGLNGASITSSSFYSASAANFPGAASARDRARTAELEASRGGVRGGGGRPATSSTGRASGGGRGGGERGGGGGGGGGWREAGVVIGPGEQFGDTALTRVGGGVRPCGAVALEPCEFATLDRCGTFFAYKSAGAGHGGADQPGASHSALSRAYAAAAQETPGVFSSRGTVVAYPGWYQT